MKKLFVFFYFLLFVSFLCAEEYYPDTVLHYDDLDATADTLLGPGISVKGAWFSNSFDIPFEPPCQITKLSFFAQRSALLDFTRIVVANPDYDVDLNGNAPDLSAPLYSVSDYTPANGINEIDLGTILHLEGTRLISALRFPESNDVKIGVDLNEPWAKKSFMTFADYLTPPTGAPEGNNLIVRLTVRPIFYLKGSETQPEKADIGSSMQQAFRFKIFSGRESVTIDTLSFDYEKDGTSTLIQRVHLFLDANGNDQLDASDIKVATTTDIDESSINFSSLSLALSSFSLKKFILATDLSSTAEDNSFFRVTVSASEKVGAVSGVTNEKIEPLLHKAVGSKVFLRGAFVLEKSPASPPAGSVLYNEKDVPVLAFSLTSQAQQVDVESIPVLIQGTVVPHVDIESVSLYEDNGTKGILDASDVQVASPVDFSIGSPLSYFEPGDLQIVAGEKKDFLVTASLTGTSGGGDDFRFTVDPSLVSGLTASGEVENAGGENAVSSLFTVSGGLLVRKLPASPESVLVSKGDERDILLFSMDASGESLFLSSLELSVSGEYSMAEKLILFEDRNRNAAFDAGDIVISEKNSDEEVYFNALSHLVESDREAWFGIRGVFSDSVTGASSMSVVVERVKALGSGSSVDVEGSGLPIGSGTVTGKGLISVSPGTATPEGKILLPLMNREPLLQLRLLPVDDRFRAKSVTFSAEGSADDTTLFDRLQLWNDANSNGIADDGELMLGEGVFSSDDSSITFSLDLVFENPINLLLTADLSSSIDNKGRTFTVKVSSSESISVNFDVSGTPVSVQGAFPIYSPLYTIGGGAVVWKGDQSPEEVDLSGIEGFVSALQFCLKGGREDFHFSSFRFKSLTGFSQGDIIRAGIAQDDNMDGIWNPGEPKWEITPDGAEFDIPTGFTLPADTARCMVFYLDYGELTAGASFRYSLISADANGVVSGSTEVSGLPILGAEHSVKGSFSFDYTVRSGFFTPGQRKLVVMPFSLTSEGENFNIRSITVRGTGAGEDELEIEKVHLIADLDGDGELSPSDSLLFSGSFKEDDGTLNLETSGLKLGRGTVRNFMLSYDIHPVVSEESTFRVTLESIDFEGEVTDPSTLQVSKSSGLFRNNAGVKVSVPDGPSLLWAEGPYPEEMIFNSIQIENLGKSEVNLSKISIETDLPEEGFSSITLFEDSDGSGTLTSQDRAVGTMESDEKFILFDETLKQSEKRIYFGVIKIEKSVPAFSGDIMIQSLETEESVAVAGVPVLLGTVNFYGDVSFIRADMPLSVEVPFDGEKHSILEFTVHSEVDTELSKLDFNYDTIPSNMKFFLKNGEDEVPGSIVEGKLSFALEKSMAVGSDHNYTLLASLDDDDGFIPFRLRLESEGVVLSLDSLKAGLPLATPLVTKKPIFSYKREPDFFAVNIINRVTDFPVEALRFSAEKSVEVTKITPVFKGDALVEKLKIVRDVNKNGLFDSSDTVLHEGKGGTLVTSLTVEDEETVLFLADIVTNPSPGSGFSMVLDRSSFAVDRDGSELSVEGGSVETPRFVVPPVVEFKSVGGGSEFVEGSFENLPIVTFSVAASGDAFAMKSIESRIRVSGLCPLSISIYRESDDQPGPTEGDTLLDFVDVSASDALLDMVNERIEKDGSVTYHITASSENCFGSFGVELTDSSLVADNFPVHLVEGLPLSSDTFTAIAQAPAFPFKMRWFARYFPGRELPLMEIESRSSKSEKISLTSSQKITVRSGLDLDSSYTIENNELRNETKQSTTHTLDILPGERLTVVMTAMEGIYTDLFVNGVPAGSVKRYPIFIRTTDRERKNLQMSGDLEKLKLLTFESGSETLNYTAGEVKENCIPKGDGVFVCAFEIDEHRKNLLFSNSITGVGEGVDKNQDTIFSGLDFGAGDSALSVAGADFEGIDITLQIVNFGKNSVRIEGAAGKYSLSKDGEVVGELLPGGSALELEDGLYRLKIEKNGGWSTLLWEGGSHLIGPVQGSENLFFIHGPGHYSKNLLHPGYTLVATNEADLKIFSGEGDRSSFVSEGYRLPTVRGRKVLLAVQPGSEKDSVFLDVQIDGKANSISVPLGDETPVSVVNVDQKTFAVSGKGALQKMTIALDAVSDLNSLGRYAVLNLLGDNGLEMVSFSPVSPEMEFNFKQALTDNRIARFNITFTKPGSIPDGASVAFSVKSIVLNGEKIDTAHSCTYRVNSSEVKDISEETGKIEFSLTSGDIHPLAVDPSCTLVRDQEIWTMSCTEGGLAGIPAAVVKENGRDYIDGIDQLFFTAGEEAEKPEGIFGGGCSSILLF